MEGHIEDKNVMKAIRGVQKECLFFKILGSYPSAD
jgi:prephenate dehydratase